MNGHRGKFLVLPPNRVWRTYTGGRMLDAMEGKEHPVDGPFSEDWIGSTVRAVNPNRRDANEGLARVQYSGKEALLADLIDADPEYFLGARHLARHGPHLMLLVKYLDSAVRLPFQVHPTVEFSRRHLHAESGKTEAYYILALRPEVEKPCIYLGFQRPPGRAELRRMIVEQDMAALARCFDPIPVKSGDVFVVPGGQPHAIGAGILMVEVMEPTDFVARIEFEVAGRIIPESARFMGRDVDFALEMFSGEPLSLSAVESRWHCAPQWVEQTANLRRESLVDKRVTDRVTVLRTVIAGSARWRPRGCTILLVTQGECVLAAGGEQVSLHEFDRIIVPHGIGDIQITTKNTVVLLECRSPQAGADS